jgi:hypothetical protein
VTIIIIIIVVVAAVVLPVISNCWLWSNRSREQKVKERLQKRARPGQSWVGGAQIPTKQASKRREP